jgi:hypothetical protein
MNRRGFLGTVSGVGIVLAGCLGQGTTPEKPTDSLTTSPAPSPTPGVESDVEVPPCPEKSDSFTRETALEFAMQFEKAYVTRTVLQEHERVTAIDIDIGNGLTNKTATQTDDGWLVRFTVTGPAYRYRPTPNSTETAHVDPPLYVANYVISEETVIRAQSVEAVDPRENGTVVHCPPE